MQHLYLASEIVLLLNIEAKISTWSFSFNKIHVWIVVSHTRLSLILIVRLVTEKIMPKNKKNNLDQSYKYGSVGNGLLLFMRFGKICQVNTIIGWLPSPVLDWTVQQPLKGQLVHNSLSTEQASSTCSAEVDVVGTFFTVAMPER